MPKVAFKNVDQDGCFTFHKKDGKQADVDGSKGYQTDDPGEIDYLDSVPFVKRAKQAGGEEG